MIINNPTFFIGYDSKEDIAYRVCKQSLLQKSSININVMSLKLNELIARKFYKRTVDPLTFSFPLVIISAMLCSYLISPNVTMNSS